MTIIEATSTGYGG